MKRLAKFYSMKRKNRSVKEYIYVPLILFVMRENTEPKLFSPSHRSSEESVLSSVVEPRHGTPVHNLCLAQCSGLFPPSFIQLLIKHLRAWLAQRDTEAVPWVGLTVYGHPDALISWGRQEHSFHTTGDNLYVLVITRECLLAYQLQGSAKPQRLYVKTNKSK